VLRTALLFVRSAVRLVYADDSAVREIEDALQNAERSGDDLALAHARMTLGVALVHRPTAAERDRGQKLQAEVSDVAVRRGHNLGDLPLINVYLARERARRGDRDVAIPLLRATVDHLFREGPLLLWGIPVTGVLVETLLRLRALLAHGHGDEAAYRDYRDRYRAKARSLGFEGHIAWAEAMP
jgi:hypothetical protein